MCCCTLAAITCCAGACALGRSIGWSQAMIGLVLVSLGTSAPELFVSAGASIQGLGDMAAGNVIGSNIINIVIVLGLAALIAPLTMDGMIRRIQFPLMCAMTIAAVVMLMDGYFSRIEALILLLSAVAGFVLAFRMGSLESTTNTDDVMNESGKSQSKSRSVFQILAGIVCLMLGAEALIWAAQASPTS